MCFKCHQVMALSDIFQIEDANKESDFNFDVGDCGLVIELFIDCDVFKVTRCIQLQAVDAIDNGIHQYDTDQPPRYVNNTSLSYRIGRLNLDWIEPDQSSRKEDEAFHRAMELAGSEFLEVFSLLYLICLHKSGGSGPSWKRCAI